MSIYMDLLHAVECGSKFRINLKEKTLKIDGFEFILQDNLIENNDLIYLGVYETEPWKVIEELYLRYKRSTPSAHCNGNKPYFKADSAEDLTDDELAFNEPRNLMQCALEGYVLLAGLSGLIEWQNENHWFWQSTLDKELIVLKEWF